MDDALSVKWLPGGDIEVGVHIADVSHFVKQVRSFTRPKCSSIMLPDESASQKKLPPLKA